ncbi:hypothetical protein SARC_11373 [Sphaeroforma arctica JP610]|uniref:Uncharacterized protein n=1 Tax=Sphaeroforma arctica JP610 TaxID=667725 RepID=A0A0L0FH73_9EUKA|nr:hypothetical protein SARC_11373 [Sphaeroforma arctica JP610]KNC76117.1 hypothetical protein SARC_11373 [Sphaeroforma arctica JP610]|eukprot:XP_014150019.1 hypothetical protein SARC_11373 [Sphaeroforma arctica JP610]
MEKRDRLVEKRKKLEELKRAREARANNVKSTASMGAGAQSGGTTHQQMQHQQQQQMDIDNLLTSILKPGDSPVSGYLSPSTQGKDIQDGHTSPNTPDIGPSTPAGNLSEDEIELSRNATPSKQRNSPYPPQHSPLQRFSNLSVAALYI